MASKNLGRLVGGIAVILGVIVVFKLLMGGGDRDTQVVVDDTQGRCDVSTKSDIPDAKRNKFVRWIIDNRCRPPQLVTVGNFRTDPSLSANDCSQATLGGAAWPFQEDETQIIHRQNRNRISLKIKASQLPGGTLTYYFDICTGDRAENKSDPRLVIDP
jgi:hypothetical protein